MKSTNKVRKSVTKALALPPPASVEIAGAPAGVCLTETGLTFTRALSEGEMKFVLHALTKVKKATDWALGDWLIAGANLPKFQESARRREKARKSHRRIPRGLCQQVADIVGVSADHLSNVASVCRRVPHQWRHPNLTIGRALEILKTDLPDLDFPYWADRAIKENLSCKQLRILLRQSLRTERPSPRSEAPRFFMEEVGEFARKFMAESESFTPGEWEAHKLTLGAVIKALHQNCQ